MSMKIRLFLILPLVLIGGNISASYQYNEQEWGDVDKSIHQFKHVARIYYTSTSLITKLFQTLDAIVAVYPERDEHVLQYLCMLQKEIQKRADNKTLSGEVLVHMIEGFENWLAYYRHIRAGEQSKILLDDIMHITDRTMRVVRQQMVREKKLIGYQLCIVQGIETTSKTIDSLKALLRVHPYKDEHLSVCLRRLEEEIHTKIAEKTLTALALVQMMKSFHHWLLYYASTATKINPQGFENDLLKAFVDEWTQAYRYVVGRIGDQIGQDEQPSIINYYYTAALPILACTTLWFIRLFFEKKSFVKSFFSTVNFEQELNNQADKSRELAQKREDLARELTALHEKIAGYGALLSGDATERGGVKIFINDELSTEKIKDNGDSFNQFTKEQIVFIKTDSNTIPSLLRELGDEVRSIEKDHEKNKQKLEKLTKMHTLMKDTWAKVNAIINTVMPGKVSLTSIDDESDGNNNSENDNSDDGQ